MRQDNQLAKVCGSPVHPVAWPKFRRHGVKIEDVQRSLNQLVTSSYEKNEILHVDQCLNRLTTNGSSVPRYTEIALSFTPIYGLWGYFCMLSMVGGQNVFLLTLSVQYDSIFHCDVLFVLVSKRLYKLGTRFFPSDLNRCPMQSSFNTLLLVTDCISS